MTIGGLQIDLLEAVGLFLTAALTIVGAYLTHNIGRQTSLRVAEKRLAAYSALWEVMRLATPVRSLDWVNDPLTDHQRHQLHGKFLDWYYADGNGLLLSSRTRTMYFRAKDNLICPTNYFEPALARQELESLEAGSAKQLKLRSSLSIRQLSLLRTRMRADLSVLGPSYEPDLSADDIAFLRLCGERLYLRPWAKISFLEPARASE